MYIYIERERERKEDAREIEAEFSSREEIQRETREKRREKEMVVRDRTKEFFSTCQVLKQHDHSSTTIRRSHHERDGGGENETTTKTPLLLSKNETRFEKKKKKGDTSTQTSSSSVFSKKASTISKQIHTTSMKLQTLSQQLRRSNGLFGHSIEDINKLTFSIKSDITFLNRQLELLEVSSQRTTNSSQSGKQMKEHHAHIVGQLQKGLLKTTKGFQGVLASRSETMKAQSDRRVKFGQHKSNSLGRPINFRRHEERMAMSSKGNIESDEAVKNLTQTRLMVREQNYLQARATAVAEMEEHITDLGHIFVRLNDMVIEQEKDIERIDDNLAIAESNASMAHTELLKYLNSVQGNRMLIAKVFGVLLFLSSCSFRSWRKYIWIYYIKKPCLLHKRKSAAYIDRAVSPHGPNRTSNMSSK